MHDLDILLDGSVREDMVEKIACFENDRDQKLYKVSIDGVDIDVGTLWPRHEEWFRKIFESAWEVGGYKFASLETVLEWKEKNVEKYAREKDMRALEKIEEFLSSNKGKSPPTS